jgi:hypothetical protein
MRGEYLDGTGVVGKGMVDIGKRLGIDWGTDGTGFGWIWV